MSNEPDEPIDEAETLVKIRRLCLIAGLSADEIPLNKAANMPPEHCAYDRNRYLEFRSKALQLADILQDEFYKSTALHDLVDICMRAGDVHDARALFNQVEVDFIQERLLAQYPQLGGSNLSGLVSESGH